MIRFLEKYRFRHLTRGQQLLLLGAVFTTVMYAGGTFLWALFIGTELTREATNKTFSQFWSYVLDWMPFYLRAWKSIVPLGTSLLAVYYIPSRPRYSGWMLGIVVTFTVLCAWYDITREDYDLATGWPRPPREYYFTWYWY
jgi:hypothetical protein